MRKTDLQIYYKAGFKYSVSRIVCYQTNIRPLTPLRSGLIELGTDGILTLHPGFSWDGATGAVDTNTNMRASSIHDALITLYREGMLPQNLKTKIDMEYFKACREDGMFWARAVLHLGAIQFNKWNKGKDPEEQVAP